MIVASLIWPLAPLEHVKAHQDGQRNAGADREGAPRAFGQRIDHGNPEAGQRDNDDEQDGNRSGRAGDRADFRSRDIGKRAAAASGGRPERNEIVHGASEATARDDPHKPRCIAELRREHRTDERSGAGYGGEMMAEEHPPTGRIVVVAVELRVRGSHARVVQHHAPSRR